LSQNGGIVSRLTRNRKKAIVEISFASPTRKPIKWEYSSRFLPGSLLVLIPWNNTRNLDVSQLLFATVEDRNIEKLEKDFVIGIKFHEGYFEKFDWEQTYVMAESTCFFGAVSPVLTALKSIDPQCKLHNIMMC
jgi:hypothetical protein